MAIHLTRDDLHHAERMCDSDISTAHPLLFGEAERTVKRSAQVCLLDTTGGLPAPLSLPVRRTVGARLRAAFFRGGAAERVSER